MNDSNLKTIRERREKLHLSQKRFAELAEISLTTLRQLEEGGKNPQQRTINKIFDKLKDIETGAIPADVVRPPRKKRGTSQAAIAKNAAKAPEATHAPVAMSDPKAEAKPLGQQVKSPAPASQQVPAAASRPAQAASSASSGLMLSNLDLELINRVLNMNAQEKLALLEKLL